MNNQMTLDEFAEALLNVEPIEVTRTLTYSFDDHANDRYDIEQTPTFTVDNVRSVVRTIKFIERLSGPLLDPAEDGEHFIIKHLASDYTAKIREFLEEAPTDVLVAWLNEVGPEVSY